MQQEVLGRKKEKNEKTSKNTILLNLTIISKKKQILAQQPFLVGAFPFGISRHICFFYEVGLSDQCPQPLFHEGNTMTYLGFEPGTFGYQVGNATN
jgi:hypothetical protein